MSLLVSSTPELPHTNSYPGRTCPRILAPPQINLPGHPTSLQRSPITLSYLPAFITFLSHVTSCLLGCAPVHTHRSPPLECSGDWGLWLLSPSLLLEHHELPSLMVSKCYGVKEGKIWGTEEHKGKYKCFVLRKIWIYIVFHSPISFLTWSSISKDQFPKM